MIVLTCGACALASLLQRLSTYTAYGNGELRKESFRLVQDNSSSLS